MFAEDILPKSLMKKAVCRTHRWDLYVEESSIKYLAFQKQVIDYVNQVYVISNDGVNYLKKLYPSFANKIYLSRLGTIDCGLDPGTFQKIIPILSGYILGQVSIWIRLKSMLLKSCRICTMNLKALFLTHKLWNIIEIRMWIYLSMLAVQKEFLYL